MWDHDVIHRVLNTQTILDVVPNKQFCLNYIKTESEKEWKKIKSELLFLLRKPKIEMY